MTENIGAIIFVQALRNDKERNTNQCTYTYMYEGILWSCVINFVQSKIISLRWY